MLWVVYSFGFWLFFLVSSLILFPVAVLVRVVTAPVDRNQVVLHQLTCFWAALYTWFNPVWSVTVEGRENIRRGEAYVMVANHQSLVDIFVLFRLFRHFKWVSKIENFKMPLIGWNMALNGYIKLRRGDRQSVTEMMQACRRVLAAGNSIMMFPEGTRSKTGEMRPFKPGAFELALSQKRPILPIVIEGTAHALPKRGWVIRGRHPIHVQVLPEIAPSSVQHMAPVELADHVRRVIAEHREPSAVQPAQTASAASSSSTTDSGARST